MLRLREGGLAHVDRIQTLCRRGDWATRALALSALGCLIREDPTSSRPSLFRHYIARRVEWLRRRFPTVGPRGRLVRWVLENALTDRSWIVRMAAALGLGECRDLQVAPLIRPLLQDTYRPVRMAAAAALGACGGAPGEPASVVLNGSISAPERIGDTAATLDWVALLCAAHHEVLSAWLELPGAPGPADSSPRAWAQLLRGEEVPEQRDSREAELVRYAQEKDRHHNLTKPFGPGPREQNVRLLHSFLVLAEHLRAPQTGRILDLGGGGGWVSELLAKLGYRPCTLDLAWPLLQVARDRFTREHLTARFVRGDMASLPFASECFDAVVAIDALHHVPQPSAVYREAHRVLRAGGQFLLAEPGEGHSEAEASLNEGLQHGVCEREVHLFEAVAQGGAAGFDEVRLVPHYVPSLSMSPADVRAAMTEPTERWTVRSGGRSARFDEFVLQSMLCHPIVLLEKGRRVLDSRAPRRLEARLEASLAREGARVRGVVRIANEGDTVWLAGGDEAGCVRLGVQLMTVDRKLIHLDFARAELPGDVPPGGGAQVLVDVVLPDGEAAYVLKLDMVDEHICWFEDGGSKPMFLRFP